MMKVKYDKNLTIILEIRSVERGICPTAKSTIKSYN